MVKKMKLSPQALGALMMALQRSLLEQSDIVPVLQDFDFYANDEGELVVDNPPTVRVPSTETLAENAEV